MPAKHLRIQVLEKGQMKVDLFMPATCAGNLQAMVPPHWMGAVASSQLNLERLSGEVVAGQYQARELFTVSLGEKSVRAWLE